MSDLRQYVQNRLRGLRLSESLREEVIDEITAHLEDEIDELRNSGVQEMEAQDALRLELGQGKQLLRRIERAKDHYMRERFQRVWLPAFTIALAAYTSQAVILRFVAWPRTVNVFGMYYVYSWAWMLAVALLGATGAWWCRERGGSPLERLIVALAPAEIMAAVVLPLLPVEIAVQAYLDRGMPHVVQHPEGLLALAWMLHPVVPAFVGALTFLFGEARHQELVAG